MTKPLSEIIKEIEQWQTKINQAKIEKAKVEGRLSGLIKNLGDYFGVEGLKEAEEKLKEIGEELEELTREVNERYEALRNEYDI